MLAADGEGGAEVYSPATTKDPGRIVFDDAQTLARRRSDFRSRFSMNVGAHHMNVLSSGFILKRSLPKRLLWRA